MVATGLAYTRASPRPDINGRSSRGKSLGSFTVFKHLKGCVMQALYSFNSSSQQYGDFFRGFPWDVIGCGTFRKPITAGGAPKLMKCYMRELGLSLNAWIPYIAVPENRDSGCGQTPIALHFHFLAACPPQWQAVFPTIASDLWTKQFGNALITQYDPSQHGAYYLAKLAGKSDFEFMLDNLDRLPYLGSDDLLGAGESSPYIPKHAKGKTFLKTLAVRDTTTGLPKERN
jgi:hypothetical protein